MRTSAINSRRCRGSSDRLAPRSPSSPTRRCAAYTASWPARTNPTATSAAASAGEKCADAERVGCPRRITIGKRGLESGEAEAQIRRGREARALPLEGVADAAAELWRELP